MVACVAVRGDWVVVGMGIQAVFGFVPCDRGIRRRIYRSFSSWILVVGGPVVCPAVVWRRVGFIGCGVDVDVRRFRNCLRPGRYIDRALMLTVLGILGTIVAYGFAGYFRKMSVDRIHPYQLQVVAGFVYGVQIPIWLWLVGRNPLIGSYDRVGVGYGVACLVMNVIGAALLGSLLKSSDSPGVITSLTAMYPVVTGLLCWGLLGEEYTPRKLIAIALMLLGVALFSY